MHSESFRIKGASLKCQIDDINGLDWVQQGDVVIWRDGNTGQKNMSHTKRVDDEARRA